ncbi:MAG TPA: alkaline phosphatase family protein [Myxococcota bacterium]|nr:alkaline phosphatase family protein [Myxococcota bacterium]
MLLALLACRPASQAERSVIVIVVDGVRVEESLSEEVSELSGLAGRDHWPGIWSELAPHGTVLTNVRNQGTTITAPAHATMFTGARIPLGNMAVDEGVGLYRPERPTIVEEARRQLDLDADEVMVMANQSLISPMTWSMMPGYGEELGATWFHVVSSPGSERPAPEDSQVFSTLERQLEAGEPRLVVANLKAVDRVGHYGDGVEDYLEAVEKVDGPLVSLWAHIQDDPSYAGNTVLIVTSDHGRHRLGDPGGDDYWRNHGTAVEGDRQIPVILLGAGVEAGIEDDTPYALSDLAPTVAALLEIDLPWAEGLPMNVALVEDVEGRSGVAQVAAAGDELVLVEYASDPGARSAVTWNGELVSSDEAWAAEAPAVVADEEVAYACWRELIQDEEASPWVPRCAMRGPSGLTDLEPPVDEVNAHWRPDMRLSDGGLALSFVDNPDDIAQPGIDGEVGPVWFRLVAGAWESGRDPDPALRYPTDAVTVEVSEGQLTAFIASTYSNDSRGDRRVYVQRSSWAEEGFAVEAPEAVDLSAVAPTEGDWRVERPALRVDGETVELLVVGVTGDDRVVLRVQSPDGGVSWNAANIVVSDASLPLHLGPLWAGVEPAWVSAAGLCTRLGCEDPGGPVKDWAWDGSELVAVVGDDEGGWALR